MNTMHASNALRRRVLLFPDASPPIPRRRPGPVLLGLATILIYTICNAPADKLIGFFAANRWWSGWLAPSHIPAEQFVQRFVIPLKGLLFVAALVCLLIPIGRAVTRGLREIDRPTLRRSAGIALGLFAFCWLLCWPYHTSMWAVGNWGTLFARMSENPFAEPHNYFHRRLLKPALAHLLLFRGPLLYWLFSMLCAAMLSFLVVLYLEISLTRKRTDAHQPPDGLLRGLAALGMMCTNLVMLHLAAPGYVDDLLAILIMLQIVLPLTMSERLCLIALSMATHEAAAVFALGPLVLVLLPTWTQRLAAWLVMFAFFAFWLASYGFDLPAAFGVHTQFEKTNTFRVFTSYPRSLAMGVFMAHKLLWGVFAVALWRLIARREWGAAAALAACTLVPLATMPIATDTSRLVGVGFAGILFSIVLQLPTLQSAGQRLFALACILSIVIPYYPSGGNWLELPAGGYYKAVYMYVRGWLPT